MLPKYVQDYSHSISIKDTDNSVLLFIEICIFKKCKEEYNFIQKK